MDPEQRALEGIFLGFQYPVEIPGVNNAEFLRMAYNAQRVYQSQEELDPLEFDDLLEEKMKLVSMDPRYKDRALNDGFSGGEKKKNEILQMAVLNPKLGVLDETDSGLDIDALKAVAQGINKLNSKDNALILITHYQRLLNYIEPHFVHVFAGGKIVKSGSKELALEVENQGYDWVATAAK
jgi:Fe-S cluster assembly ATP-binding protein